MSVVELTYSRKDKRQKACQTGVFRTNVALEVCGQSAGCPCAEGLRNLHNRFILLLIMAVVPFVMATAFAAIVFICFVILNRNAKLRTRAMLAYAAIGLIAVVNLRMSYVALDGAASWFSVHFDWLRHFLAPMISPKSTPRLMDAFFQA